MIVHDAHLSECKMMLNGYEYLSTKSETERTPKDLRVHYANLETFFLKSINEDFTRQKLLFHSFQKSYENPHCVLSKL